MVTLYALIKVLVRIATQLKRIADAQEEMVIHRRLESTLDEDEHGWAYSIASKVTTIKDQMWWLTVANQRDAVAANKHLHPEVARELWAMIVGEGYSCTDYMLTMLVGSKNTPDDVLTQIAGCNDASFIAYHRNGIKMAADRLAHEDIV